MCLPTLSDIASKPLERSCAAHRKCVQLQVGRRRNKQTQDFCQHLGFVKFEARSNCRECRVGRVNDLPRLKYRCLPKPIKATCGRLDGGNEHVNLSDFWNRFETIEPSPSY
jgi:hypothetical protein